MAGNEVTLTFTGNSADLEKSFDKVGEAADTMSGEVGKATKELKNTGAAFDKAGEGSDVMERRARGLSDTIGGTQDTMAGWSAIMKGDTSAGLMQVGMGVADLAGGMSDLIIPLAGQVASWVSGHFAMAGAAVTSAATQVGAWISLGVTSLISAAQVALAWLISIGPLILVGAAVIALVYLIVRNWDTIREVVTVAAIAVKNVVVGAFNWMKDAVGVAMSAISSVVNGQIEFVLSIFRFLRSSISSIMGGVADAITNPFRVGFAAIRGIWNSTIGGKGFSVPGWIPGIGGKEFRIPFLAQGGIVSSPTLALIGEAGPEAVVPLSRSSGPGLGGPVTLVIDSAGSQLDRLMLNMFRKAIKKQGGGVQLVVAGAR